MKYRISAVILILIAIGLGYFVYFSHTLPFRLGLDLAGGVQLLYTADTSSVQPADVGTAMDTLRDVIERRVNLFGVSEPVVQVQRGGALGTSGSNQLLVELPGVTDIQQAITLIGKTPTLEFKLVNEGAATDTVSFTDTGLTGRLLDSAQLVFDPNTSQPLISLQFNSEGATLFGQITTQNIGKPLAIFLDGEVISSPVIQSAITDGKAEINGTFTTAEAQTLVNDLNYGALPLPVILSSTESIGPSLGTVAIHAGLVAGIVGFILLSLFLILWYRLPGVIATVALALYVMISLAVFRLIPVTLTAAGIAGFVLSVGMAVDANILIFERVKEELKRGKDVHDALHEGFARAWLSIRDSNISSIITAIVLFWLGTSAVKGFALTLGIGVAISMFTAITASRTFLYAVAPKKGGRVVRFLFSNGFHTK